MDRNSLISRLNTSRPGEVTIYYTGYLASDRAPLTATSQSMQIDSVADTAWTAYGLGQVALVQRRLGDRRYEYLAIRLGTQARSVAKRWLEDRVAA